MRVTAAFSGLLDLPGVWVRSVCFEPRLVVVTVVLGRITGISSDPITRIPHLG
jgi:hypothetical protein